MFIENEMQLIMDKSSFRLEARAGELPLERKIQIILNFDNYNFAKKLKL